MSWAALVLALLRALPMLLALLKSVDDRARAAQARGEGYNEAVAAGLDKMRVAVESDAIADAETARDHAAHPGEDAGYDTEFRRKS